MRDVVEFSLRVLYPSFTDVSGGVGGSLWNAACKPIRFG
jgi:hypothetical protein